LDARWSFFSNFPRTAVVPPSSRLLELAHILVSHFSFPCLFFHPRGLWRFLFLKLSLADPPDTLAHLRLFLPPPLSASLYKRRHLVPTFSLFFFAVTEDLSIWMFRISRGGPAFTRTTLPPSQFSRSRCGDVAVSFRFTTATRGDFFHVFPFHFSSGFQNRVFAFCCGAPAGLPPSGSFLNPSGPFPRSSATRGFPNFIAALVARSNLSRGARICCCLSATPP